MSSGLLKKYPLVSQMQMLKRSVELQSPACKLRDVLVVCLGGC